MTDARILVLGKYFELTINCTSVRLLSFAVSPQHFEQSIHAIDIDRDIATYEANIFWDEARRIDEASIVQTKSKSFVVKFV